MSFAREDKFIGGRAEVVEDDAAGVETVTVDSMAAAVSMELEEEAEGWIFSNSVSGGVVGNGDDADRCEDEGGWQGLMGEADGRSPEVVGTKE